MHRMKRWISSLLAILMIFCTFPMVEVYAEDEEVQNLLQDGGFESGNLSQNWVVKDQFSADNTVYASGQYSAKAEGGTEDTTILLSQYIDGSTFDGMKGGTYQISAKIRTENVAGTGVDVRVAMKTESGTDITPFFLGESRITGSTEDWVTLSKEITIPEDTEAVKLGIQCYYKVTAGTAWFDDLLVTEISAPPSEPEPEPSDAPNELYNGDFEIAQDMAPTGWVPYPADSGWVLDSDEKQNGNQSARIAGSSGSSATVFSGYISDAAFEMMKGKTYLISGYVKAAGADTDAVNIKVSLKRADGSDANVFWLDDTGYSDTQDEWKYISKEIEIPKDTEASKMGVQCYFKSAAGTAWFDNLSVQCVDEGSGNDPIEPSDPIGDNFVVNPGFEEDFGINPGEAQGKWTTWSAFPDQTTYEVDQKVSHTGNQSAKIINTGTAAYTSIYNQDLPLELLGKYVRVSGWIRTEEVAGSFGATIGLSLRNAEGTTLENHYICNGMKGTQEWTYVEKIIYIPDNLGITRIALQCNLSNATGTVWYDDIAVEEYIPVTEIKLEEAFRNVGMNTPVQISYALLPENASVKQLRWESENPEIAEVDENGEITGKAVGYTVITAYADQASAKIVVNVVDGEPPEALELQESVQSTLQDVSVSFQFQDDCEYEILEQPQHGIIRMTTAGEWAYYPDRGYVGGDQFLLLAVQPSTNQLGLAQASVSVENVNDAPVLEDTVISTQENTPVNAMLEALDADEDTLTYSLAESAQHGTAEVQENGEISYAPAASYIGVDQFLVAVSDGQETTNCRVTVYTAPSVETVKNDFEQSGKSGVHPRLFASQSDFDRIKQYIENEDSYIVGWSELICQEAEDILFRELEEYPGDNVQITKVGRDFLSRVQVLAMAWQLTGKNEYADRVYAEMQAIAAFPNWGEQSHYADTAEILLAWSIGYDWLYSYWTEDQRTEIVQTIVEKGLSKAESSQQYISDTSRENNRNMVINGGVMSAVMALLDETERDSRLEPLLDEFLDSMFQSISLPLSLFDRYDGTWYEGPGYWNYGTSYFAFFCDALQSVLGKDYGVTDFPGLENTVDYIIDMKAPGGIYNYSDTFAGQDAWKWPNILWFANQYDREDYYAAHRTSAALSGNFSDIKEAYPAFDLLWYPGEKAYQTDSVETGSDAYYQGVEVVTMTGAEDPMGSYVGFKGGDNAFDHNHYDIGSFIYDALGVRWALDLGYGTTSVPMYHNKDPQTGSRWKIYSYRAEGHNTLLIDPGNYPDQDWQAVSKVTEFESTENNTQAYAIADLTAAYSDTTYSAKRGLFLMNGKKDLIVQDEIMNRRNADVYWFMHTKAAIEILEDGKSALLTSGDKRLYVQILSEQGEFSVLPAECLPEEGFQKYESWSDVQKLTVLIPDALDVQLSIRMVPLMPGESIPADTPAVIPLSDWAVQEEAVMPDLDVTVQVGDTQYILNRQNPEIEYMLPYGVKEIPTISAWTDHTDYEVSVEFTPNSDEWLPFVSGYAAISVTSKSNPQLTKTYSVRIREDWGVTASETQEGYYPEYSIDGNYDGESRWPAKGEHWIQYYLGETLKEIDSVSITFWKGDTRTFKFDLLVSEDGQEWTEVLHDVISSGTTTEAETFSFEPVQARYIRFFGHGNSNLNQYNHIVEFVYHGEDITDSDTGEDEEEHTIYFPVPDKKPDNPSSIGWQKELDGWKHYGEDGRLDTGWFLDVNGKWYYLDQSGVMKTGWFLDTNGKWYYLDQSGAMKTGWFLDTNGKWYYLDQSGAMKTGWFLDTNGKWYYLDQSGAMKTGWFLDANGKWYYLDQSGAMKTGWFLDANGKWYYLAASGDMVVDCWIGNYYINPYGVWVK